jgi:hypothetical protein
LLTAACGALLCVTPTLANDHPQSLVGQWQCHDALLGWDMELGADGICHVDFDIDGVKVRSEGRWAVERGRLVIRVDGERSDYELRWGGERGAFALSGAELDGAEVSFSRRAGSASDANATQTAAGDRSPGEPTGNWLHRREASREEVAYTFREDGSFTRARRTSEMSETREGTWKLLGKELTLHTTDGSVERYTFRVDGDRMHLIRRTAHGHQITMAFTRSGVEVAQALIDHR